MFSMASLSPHREFTASWKDRKSVVARIWRGRTKASDADDYAVILRRSLDDMAGKTGNLGVQMFRQNAGDITNFMVISYWPSMDAMKSWSSDVTRIRALPEDEKYLLELPEFADFYNLQHNAWVIA
jgi:heme-degrading monooxygenase HmoA